MPTLGRTAQPAIPFLQRKEIKKLWISVRVYFDHPVILGLVGEQKWSL